MFNEAEEEISDAHDKRSCRDRGTRSGSDRWDRVDTVITNTTINDSYMGVHVNSHSHEKDKL